MPGNDLTASRALVPTASDTRAVARANITTLLTNILDDIEPSVTPAQINVNSDLSFLSGGTKYAATNVQYLGLHDRSTDTSQVESVYVKGGELYYHDGAGNKFALTAGGSAVAGATGDITGTWTGSPEAIEYHTGTTQFRFRHNSAATDLADLVMSKARFSDGAGTDYATLGAQSGMSGVVDYSLPLAAPAGTYLMTMDTSGNMAHTTTPSVSTLSASGAISSSTTITATGDMSADEYKITGTKVLVMTGPDWVPTLGGTYGANGEAVSGATAACFLSVGLTAGDRITDLQAYGTQGSAGTMTFSLHTVDDTGAVSAAIGVSDTTTSTGRESLTIASLTETVVAANASYVLKLVSTGSGGVTAGNVAITYDRP